MGLKVGAYPGGVGPKRGLCTVAALRARCCIDATTGCWHWQGASDDRGVPRLHTFDHERGEKRVMNGPKAAWNIAHGAAPARGFLVFRRCVTRDCMNPVHMAEARSLAEIGAHVSRTGRRKGHTDLQMQAAARGRAALGITPTPMHLVAAIRLANPEVDNTRLGEYLGLPPSTVSRIRLGRTHRMKLEGGQ